VNECADGYITELYLSMKSTEFQPAPHLCHSSRSSYIQRFNQLLTFKTETNPSTYIISTNSLSSNSSKAIDIQNIKPSFTYIQNTEEMGVIQSTPRRNEGSPLILRPRFQIGEKVSFVRGNIIDLSCIEVAEGTDTYLFSAYFGYSLGGPARKKKWYQEGALYHEGELEKQLSAVNIERVLKQSDEPLGFFQVGEKVGIVLHDIPEFKRKADAVVKQVQWNKAEEFLENKLSKPVEERWYLANRCTTPRYGIRDMQSYDIRYITN
jgi:hypothetical protein